MKRLAGLFLALTMLMVVPIAPAMAEDTRIEAVVRATEVPVAIADDGATLTAGTFVFLVDGVVVETGTVEGRYYERPDGVHGTRHFVDDSTGNTVDTEVKAHIFAVSPDGTVIRYRVQETIVASTDGVMGRAQGRADVTLLDDGSFVLQSIANYILTLPI